ncbi:MAG TPA: hypothetical protein VK515_05865 [Rhizomicrobium sp.]|nr:hypothetical protein [Rhizomicrobium sp.]
MNHSAGISRKIARLLVASGALLLALGLGNHAAATAAHAKHHAHTAHKSSAHRKPRLAAGKHSSRKAVATAKSKPIQQAVITTKAHVEAPDFDFQPRIQEAQALAAKQPVLPGDMVVSGSSLASFNWVLVVGQKTGPLTVLRMDEQGRNDQGFNVTWPVNNYLNTKFTVESTGAPGTPAIGAAGGAMTVFAQRRPVRGKGGFEEAVYTAYAPELDTQKMRDAGMDYLRTLEHLAYNRVNDHDVRSLAAPAKTVAEEIPRDMVLRLMITEHVDPLHMKFVGIEQCVHEVLITIAANRDKSYAYARSSAGALGLPQFMESSYQMVRSNYPKALLEPDFNLGMTNLHNAVLASLLLLDLELTELPQATLRKVSDSSKTFAAYLAAGYNRNPVHVVKTYLKTNSMTGGHAPFENKMYVRIQAWVGDFLKKEYDVR